LGLLLDLITEQGNPAHAFSFFGTYTGYPKYRSGRLQVTMGAIRQAKHLFNCELHPEFRAIR
jgi:hypothetical protein